MRAFMEVNQHLHSYKEAFTSETVMDVLGSMLADLSQKVWSHVFGFGGSWSAWGTSLTKVRCLDDVVVVRVGRREKTRILS